MIKKVQRRTIMTILVVLALFSTFESVTGVQAMSIVSYMNKYKMQNNEIASEHQSNKSEFTLFRNKYISKLYEQPIFTTITNFNNKENEKSNSTHPKKQSKLSLKSLNNVERANFKISSSESYTGKPPLLENAFDWSQYEQKRVVATGYTAGYESTGKHPNHPQYGITFSGVKVKRDLYSTVAADLNVFPIGTILFVPGYGYGVVADKGGAIKGNKIDLYYETVDEVYKEWGKKEVDVYVIEMGSGRLTEQELVSLNENETMQVFRQQIVK